LRELGESIWQVCRRENTVPEDALQGYIKGLCRGRRFLIFRGVSGIVPLYTLLAFGLDYFDLSIVVRKIIAKMTGHVTTHPIIS
jgi:hypothetical protein